MKTLIITILICFTISNGFAQSNFSANLTPNTNPDIPIDPIDPIDPNDCEDIICYQQMDSLTFTIPDSFNIENAAQISDFIKMNERFTHTNPNCDNKLYNTKYLVAKLRIGASRFSLITRSKKWKVLADQTLTKAFLVRIGFSLGKESIDELTELERINNNRAVLRVELEVAWACQGVQKSLLITKDIILYFTNYRGVPGLLN